VYRIIRFEICEPILLPQPPADPKLTNPDAPRIDWHLMLTDPRLLGTENNVARPRNTAEHALNRRKINSRGIPVCAQKMGFNGVKSTRFLEISVND
jgi:hypothetical protein